MKRNLMILGIGIIFIGISYLGWLIYQEQQILNNTQNNISTQEQLEKSLPTEPSEVMIVRKLLHFSKEQNYEEALETLDDYARVEYRKNKENIKKIINSVSESGKMDRFEITHVEVGQDQIIRVGVAVFVKEERFNKRFELQYNKGKGRWEIINLVKKLNKEKSL